MKRGARLPLPVLLGDCQGSSALEFALLIPVLFAFFAGSFDLARCISMKLALAQATARTAEMATGRNVVADSYGYLQSEAQAAYGAPLLSSQITNVRQCDGVPSDSFTGSCTSGSQTTRIVIIGVAAEFVPLFNWGGLLTGNGPNSGIVLQDTTTVRVE